MLMTVYLKKAVLLRLLGVGCLLVVIVITATSETYHGPATSHRLLL